MKKLLLALAVSTVLTVNVALAEDYAFEDMDQYEEAYDVGMYRIGIDIEPGKYRAIAKGDKKGSFNVTEDANQKDRVTSGYFKNFAYVNLADEDYVELKDCFLVPLDAVDPIPIENDLIQDGWYLVGYDIPAGEYKVDVIDSDTKGHVYVYDDLETLSRDTSSYFEQNIFVSVTNGQYLVLKDAEIKSEELSVLANDTSTEEVISQADGELLQTLVDGGSDRDEVIDRYCSNVLNAMIYKDMGKVNYNSDEETFELVFNDDEYYEILETYLDQDLDDHEDWDLMLEMLETSSTTISNDMGADFKLSVLSQDGSEVLLTLKDGELIE